MLKFSEQNFSFDQYFSNTISRILLPVEGAHAAACEEMGTAISNVEGAAHKGLLQCIDTVMAEVCLSHLAPYICTLTKDCNSGP